MQMMLFDRVDRRLGTGITLAVCLLAAARAASAAEAAAPEPDALQEIVVTAQHKEENVQSTPIAMSVYTADAIKQNNIVDMAGLAAFAPDVNFSEAEGEPIITVRGISSLDTTENGDPAVAVNTDGFYVNRAYGLDASIYDIDRIEVLRGPQGTLNGRNAIGGAVNIVTAQPTDTFAAYTSISYGNYNALSTQGMVNLPISDTVQLRAAFLTVSHDGYRNNAPQPDADDADNKSGRVELAFEPFEHFKGLVTVQFTKEGGYGDSLQNIPYIYTHSGALNTNLPPGINPYTFPILTTPSLSLDDRVTRLNLTYDLGGVLLTALAGYDHMEWHHASDESSTINTPPINTFIQNEYPNTFNGELRAASKGNSPFQWQVGTFYFQEKSHLVSYNGAPTGDTTPDPYGSYSPYFAFVYQTKSHSAAGYGQASYQLTDDLKLTGGVRYTSDFKGETGFYGDLAVGPSSGYAYQSGSSSSTKTTYHLALDYNVTAKNLVYAKWDTGYKTGGFNFGGAPYNPETVTAYEVGSKNRFFADTLQWNTAAFLENDDGQQVSTYAFLPNGLAEALTENAGKAKIWGLETDFIYKVPYVGTLNLTVDYLHARYVDFVSIADPSDPTAHGNVQLAGNTPPQSPALSAQAGLERGWEAFHGTVTGRIQTKVQSPQNFSFYDFPDTAQKGYTMSDAFLSYEPSHANSGAHWKVTAYVKNLENAAVFSTAQEDTYAFAYTYQWFPPRTYGLRLETSW
jgi:iron complex outermembrane receptor protein